MMNSNLGTVASLIAADKVKDAKVFNRKGEKLGTVDDILIDRTSGRAIYAVLSFGGFLGMNEKHHLMPWATLTYDTKMGGYVVDLDKKILEAALANPAFAQIFRTAVEKAALAQAINEAWAMMALVTLLAVVCLPFAQREGAAPRPRST